jgi:hypothetical protein
MTPSSPELPFRKRLIRRLDSLAGEVNRCLAVAAIGLACLDLVTYAVVFSQTHRTRVDAAPWSGPGDAVGAAPVIGVDGSAK